MIADSIQRMIRKRTRLGSVDVVLAALVIALIGFGVVMVYSASAIEATVVHRDPQYFLKRQAVYAGLALAVMYVVARFDYQRLRPLTYPILGAVTLLLILSVVGFGHTGGGAARWLRLGPIHVQPSEAAKLALVLWLAYSLEKKREQVKSFSIGMLPHLIMAGSLMLLCLKQPDFGGAAVLLFLTFTLLFVAGARLGYLLGAAMLGAGFAVWAVRFTNYRWERMLAWFNMAEHRQDLAYQPFQSVMSFGSGELSGLGLGKGFQALYLPEAHTDFIASIVGEELGFVGILGLCSVYLCIVARGVRTALLAEDDYGSYIAFGLSVLFGIQALINMAVAMALLPTKGLTLPFVSYGGSSLLVNATAVGVLLNISRPRLGPANQRATTNQGEVEPEASAVVATEAKYAPEAPKKRTRKPARVVQALLATLAASALALAAGTTYQSSEKQITIRQSKESNKKPARPVAAYVRTERARGKVWLERTKTKLPRPAPAHVRPHESQARFGSERRENKLPRPAPAYVRTEGPRGKVCGEWRKEILL